MEHKFPRGYLPRPELRRTAKLFNSWPMQRSPEFSTWLVRREKPAERFRSCRVQTEGQQRVERTSSESSVHSRRGSSKFDFRQASSEHVGFLLLTFCRNAKVWISDAVPLPSFEPSTSTLFEFLVLAKSYEHSRTLVFCHGTVFRTLSRSCRDNVRSDHSIVKYI